MTVTGVQGQPLSLVIRRQPGLQGSRLEPQSKEKASKQTVHSSQGRCGGRDCHIFSAACCVLRLRRESETGVGGAASTDPLVTRYVYGAPKVARCCSVGVRTRTRDCPEECRRRAGGAGPRLKHNWPLLFFRGRPLGLWPLASQPDIGSPSSHSAVELFASGQIGQTMICTPYMDSVSRVACTIAPKSTKEISDAGHLQPWQPSTPSTPIQGSIVLRDCDPLQRPHLDLLDYRRSGLIETTWASPWKHLCYELLVSLHGGPGRFLTKASVG